VKDRARSISSAAGSGETQFGVRVANGVTTFTAVGGLGVFVGTTALGLPQLDIKMDARSIGKTTLRLFMPSSNRLEIIHRASIAREKWGFIENEGTAESVLLFRPILPARDISLEPAGTVDSEVNDLFPDLKVGMQVPDDLQVQSNSQSAHLR